MKFNGTIFSKPQQDQLKENIGNELEKVSAKVDEVDARMLSYKTARIYSDRSNFADTLNTLKNAAVKGGFVMLGSPNFTRRYEIMSFTNNRYSLFYAEFNDSGLFIEIIYQTNSISMSRKKYTIGSDGTITQSSSTVSDNEKATVYYLE